MTCYGGAEDEEVLEPDGVCPECGTETKNGESIYPGCCYSPVVCKTCGDQPCDQSC